MIKLRSHQPYKTWVLLVVMALLLVSAAPVSAAPKKLKPVRIKANAGWVETKVWLEVGQKLTIRATGRAITAPLRDYPKSKSGPEGQTWGLTCGEYTVAPPPCAMNYAPYGALVGKIGNGAPFLIGASEVIIASRSGYLWLAVNDNLAYYKDNKGGYAVRFK